jgi:hypothetical protein
MIAAIIVRCVVVVTFAVLVIIGMVIVRPGIVRDGSPSHVVEHECVHRRQHQRRQGRGDGRRQRAKEVDTGFSVHPSSVAARPDGGGRRYVATIATTKSEGVPQRLLKARRK